MPKRSHQVAALPWRLGENGIEILLVTTRTTKRWVIPKGWTMDGKADHEAAAIEAYEEAGVRGVTSPIPIGQYHYFKVLKDGNARQLEVNVYALSVTEVLSEWPERLERERQWVAVQEACQLVGEPELIPLLSEFSGVARPMPHLADSLFLKLRRWWQKFFNT